MISEAIKSGAPLHHVYRVASWSAANAFGLRDRGLIAPGKRADIVLVSDLEACSVKRVYSAGRQVGDVLFAARKNVAPVGLKSVRSRELTADDFSKPGKNPSPVIGVVPGRIITEHLSFDLAGVELDLEKDALKLAVVERHGKNGNIGIGHVHGFGLKKGAIASSVGHDSHNITVVGANLEAMAMAANRIIELQGGFVVADNERVVAEIGLPVAGLMSLKPFGEVRSELETLRDAARLLGCVLPEPFLQVAFLPLPVIPHLKITDLGLFDVDAFALIEA